jgi:hypothetical protein
MRAGARRSDLGRWSQCGVLERRRLQIGCSGEDVSLLTPAVAVSPALDSVTRNVLARSLVIGDSLQTFAAW